MRKLWAKQNGAVVQCENFALVRKFALVRNFSLVRNFALVRKFSLVRNFAQVQNFRTGAKILIAAKFRTRTGANDLVMLVIFTCLVLRYRILYHNITSPSAQ